MMKKLLLIVGLAALCAGCMTDRQLQAEKAFYSHMTAVAKAQQSQPLVKITPAKPGDPILIENLGAIEVFSPPPPLGDFARQYQHRDFTPAWVPPVISAVSTVGMIYGVGYSIKKALDAGSGTSYYQNISGTGNTATIRQAGSTTLSGGIAGNSNMIGGMIDNTADPTVVKVDPFIVEPFVVDPVLVPVPAQ